jgi:hypothetical protein
MIEVYFRPTIELADIEIDYNPSYKKNDVEYVTKNLGKYPYVYYRGLDIDPNDIIKFKLSNNAFLPQLKMTFRDKSNKMFDDTYPTDNEIISVFIRSLSEVTMPIRMDFKIMEFDIQKPKPGEFNELIYSIVGELNVDYLYYYEFESFPQQTSFEVYQEMSKRSNLGFVSNIDNSNDAMTWINNGQRYSRFLYEVMMRSYLSDDTFLFGFVDFYYFLNYVDIEQQLSDDISEAVGTSSAAFISSNYKEEIKSLKLTNHPNYNSTDQYIDQWYISNDTTRVNTNNGYTTNVRWYDKTETQYNVNVLDTISTVGDNQLILKDVPGKEDFYNTVQGGKYLNKIDQDNVHINWAYSYMQNKNNLDFLQKIKMNINLKVPNFNLYRFQKILVEIYKLSELDAEVDKTKKPANKNEFNQVDDSKLNKRLSGEWLITGINFNFDNENGNTQEITLIKRELSIDYNSSKKN